MSGRPRTVRDRALAPCSKNAEELIHYYYDPEAMAEMGVHISYVGPVLAVEDAAAPDSQPIVNEAIFTGETAA